MADASSRQGRTRSYFEGVLALAAARVRHRVLAGEARQTLLSLLGIALAVTLMLTVVSVSLGLAAQGTIQAQSTDFWIVPETGASSPVTQIEGTKLGRTHQVADRLSRRDDVVFATPVLIELVPFRAGGSPSEHVLLVGVVPGADARTILGLSTESLRSGDPYYNAGGYNGSWTGEAVVSESAAQALNVTIGSEVRPATREASDRTFVVGAVERARSPGIGQLPVVMVHLSESQVVTGDDTGDQADHLLVDATDPAVKSSLERVYPETKVMTDRELLAQQFLSSDLPLATSIAAVIVAVLVGLLTIITTVGFEFVDDAETRAVLAALGLSGKTRVVLLTTETLITAFAGGCVGVLGWVVSVVLVNTIGNAVVDVPLAVMRPEMAIGGLAVATGIGLLSLPYLFVLSSQTSLIEALPTK